MTQRNKNILLILGFLLILFLSYKWAFSRTFFLKNEIQRMESSGFDLSNLANLSTNLAQRERFADSVLERNNIKDISIQNSLLEFLNIQSQEKGFSIAEFSEPHHAVINEVKVTSYRFVLSGNYRVLEETIYLLEKRNSFGQVSHLGFSRERDYRRGRDYLTCSVILEIFEEN